MWTLIVLVLLSNGEWTETASPLFEPFLTEEECTKAKRHNEKFGISILLDQGKYKLVCYYERKEE